MFWAALLIIIRRYFSVYASIGVYHALNTPIDVYTEEYPLMTWDG